MMLFVTDVSCVCTDREGENEWKERWGEKCEGWEGEERTRH